MAGKSPNWMEVLIARKITDFYALVSSQPCLITGRYLLRWCTKNADFPRGFHLCLVVSIPLKKISQLSVGMIIPNIWKNKSHVPVTTNQIFISWVQFFAPPSWWYQGGPGSSSNLLCQIFLIWPGKCLQNYGKIHHFSRESQFRLGHGFNRKLFNGHFSDFSHSKWWIYILS